MISHGGGGEQAAGVAEIGVEDWVALLSGVLLCGGAVLGTKGLESYEVKVADDPQKVAKFNHFRLRSVGNGFEAIACDAA